MKIMVAKTAGFCFGVDRAVKAVYNNINKDNLVTYGPIIHNTQVVSEMRNKGVKAINHLDEIEQGTVIIRSHGVPKKIYDHLEEKRLEYIDATCPFVKRIHRIVKKSSDLGETVVIVGNKDHPEVLGINGWCNNQGIIIEDAGEENLALIPKDQRICLVVQTTFDQYKFKNIVEVLQELGYNLNVFSTICDSTYNRQQEAIKIAKEVDEMIVIGGKHSSNTQKLYNLCRKHCAKTYHIETVEDLQMSNFKEDDVIGISAGASTPKRIIEEVINSMNELRNEELSFEEMLNESFKEINRGDVVKGKVIQVNPVEAILNVGYKSDGVLTRDEYTNDVGIDLTDELNEGDEVDCLVMNVNDRDGHVLVSRKRLLLDKDFEKIEEACNNGDILTEKVSQIVKGGAIVLIGEVKVFIPVSIFGAKFNEDLKPYVGKDISFKITECNRRRRRVIGNRKVVIQEANKVLRAKALETLEEGSKVIGTVKSITSYGAFIDLNGIDGLLHVSEMSWGKVNNPADFVKEGQSIEVIIKELNKEKGKVALTLKEDGTNPWTDAEEKYAVDSVVDGKVVRFAKFGAFIELETGIDALLHISQISNKFIEKPEEALTVGETVQVKVIEFNKDDKKISLSKKALEEPVAEEATTEEVTEA